jgi:hypothetical protein
MPRTAEAVAATPREAFLAASIAAMLGCGLLSFALSGRVTARTHGALALLVVLIGGFSLFVLFGASSQTRPFVGAATLFALIGLFKLMSRFETSRDRGKNPPVLRRSE